MFNQAIVGHALPARLSFDHDRLFEFHRWQANLRILQIESVRSVPYSPEAFFEEESSESTPEKRA
jgi:putative transposase